MATKLPGFGPARTVGELKQRLDGLDDSTPIYYDGMVDGAGSLEPIEVSSCEPDEMFPHGFTCLGAWDSKKLTAGTLTVLKAEGIAPDSVSNLINA